MMWWRICNRCARRLRRRRKERHMGISRLFLLGAVAGAAMAQVSPDRLLNAAREPQQWLTYSGTYNGQRISALDQINIRNVHQLALQWVFQTGVKGAHETTP